VSGHKSLRIACVGHAALDHVYEVKAIPTEATKTLAHRYRARAGGMSLHASIAAARLGATARLLGRVGDDPAGAFLRDALRREGVQHQGLEAVPAASTSVATVIVDAQGARQIYIHRGDALTHAHALDLRQLEGAELVLADPRWPDGAACALHWARDHGVPSMLDADVAPREVIDRLLPLARWVVFSEHGLAAWAPEVSHEDAMPDALARALACGPALVAVTLGAQGVQWIGANGALHAAQPPAVKARDTTGAGDVFHAALAMALVEGRDDAFGWACAAAAYKCEQGRGIDGAPTREQLEAWRGRASLGGGG
jgi:sulfofructose kinase